MIFDREDYLSRLRAGENAEDIGAEIAKMLQEADIAYQRELEAERQKAEAERFKSIQKQERYESAKRLAEALHEYMMLCDPDAFAGVPSITADEIESIFEEVSSIMRLVDAFPFLNFFTPTIKADAPEKETSNPDKIIADFLNKIGV